MREFVGFDFIPLSIHQHFIFLSCTLVTTELLSLSEIILSRLETCA